MMVHEGIESVAEAVRMAQRAYDVSCDKLNCPTPKEQRGTDMYYGVSRNPIDGKYALIIHPDHWHDYREAERAKFRTMTDGDIAKYNLPLDVLLAVAGKTSPRGS